MEEIGSATIDNGKKSPSVKSLSKRLSYSDVSVLSNNSPQPRPNSRWDLIRRRVKMTTGPSAGVAHPTGLRAILKRVSSKKHPLDSERESQDEVQKENTYQLGPNRPFATRQVREAIQDILVALLQDQPYDVTKAGKLTKRITEAVKTRVKAMKFSRHKLVVHTVMGSKAGQGVQVGSRCLWNQNTDNSATCSIENKYLFTVITVYGIYFE
ncbi:Tctex1 domain-containing protein 1 [Holothuria leucospilota]|uniref:Tctex1 domain-containing protein 1 n=1 Tax=Holothuria leucospilota TaxID=206669 RepID=A0A9Q0YTS7_HOLLE|nr:Tctex1 domain-containing protein 1 [Holothuria leucospilota]